MSEVDYGPRLGADPELFVQTAENKIVPICGKIGGTKEEPLIIDNLIEAQYGKEVDDKRSKKYYGRQGHYAIQEDNVMLEFNVPAYRDAAGFQDAIAKMLTVLSNTVLVKDELTIKYEIMHTFKAEEIALYPQALTIGCLPDMDAYSETGIFDPISQTSTGFDRAPFSASHFGNHRFCGGHMHVQYNKNNVPPHVFAQFMDLVAELPFLRWDRQKMRRMFYGQPGLYREKPYGIEYRTLSNFWLTKAFRDKWLGQLVENVFMLATAANTDPEKLKNSYEKIDWSEVQQAIQTENIPLADEMIEFARYKAGINMSPPAPR